jgi:DNA-binding HxlR family transcriptional regulator
VLDRDAFGADNCSVARTLAVVGEKWTLLVLREAFYGVRRFDDMQRHLGCARNVLAARLQTLVDHEVLTRSPYREPGSRERYEYRLTASGRELLVAVVALMQWGDEHLGDPTGPPVLVTHTDCGARVRAALSCADGHHDLTSRDTAAVPGPGAVAAAS